jgi:hypothetical protein
MFSNSEVRRFKHTNKSLRYGQAFYNFMKLHKVSDQQDKEFCERLYNADDEKAKTMIRSRTDTTQ